LLLSQQLLLQQKPQQQQHQGLRQLLRWAHRPGLALQAHHSLLLQQQAKWVSQVGPCRQQAVLRVPPVCQTRLSAQAPQPELAWHHALQPLAELLQPLLVLLTEALAAALLLLRLLPGLQSRLCCLLPAPWAECLKRGQRS
jgi:hypothetical protein